MATKTAMRGGFGPPFSAIPRYSHAARAANATVTSVISHRGPRNTKTRTNGIKTRAVRMRFMPRLRIHCSGELVDAEIEYLS